MLALSSGYLFSASHGFCKRNRDVESVVEEQGFDPARPNPVGVSVLLQSLHECLAKAE